MTLVEKSRSLTDLVDGHPYDQGGQMNKKYLAIFVAVLATLATFSVNPATAKGPSAPERIISLSPTATEMLFAISAGSQVVAVDDQSDYPANAPTTALSGIDVNAEAIAALTPDLVVASDDTAKSALDALGIKLLILPAADTLNDTYSQINKLGKVTRHIKKAKTVVANMKSKISRAAAKVQNSSPQPTAFYELDDTLYSATSKTFIGQLLAKAGFKNIADKAKGAGSGYPQLSAEYVVDSNPKAIFLADGQCCAQNANTVAARPGFSQISAVKDNHIFILDDDIASRWGPRVVDLFNDMVNANLSL